MRELSIVCPRCGAGVGYKCFTASGRSLMHGYHVARRKACYEQVEN